MRISTGISKDNKVIFKRVCIMKNATKILFGVVAIAFGVIYFGDVFDFWSVSSFRGWWTLFIIVPAIGNMLSSKINAGNVAFLIFGIWLLVSEQGWIDNQKLNGITISISLILLGTVLIFSEFKNKAKLENSQVEVVSESSFRKKETESNSERPSFFAVFGGNQSKCSSKNLRGGEATAIFGGIELDLSDAIPSGNVAFNATAIFGGIDIVPPKGFKVETTGVALLGGCDNQVQDSAIDNLPIFTIKYFTLFGGVDIVNLTK